MGGELNEMTAVLNFFAEAGLLKRVRRSGWWVAGIDDPESVADHSFRTAVIGFHMAYLEKVDPFRRMRKNAADSEKREEIENKPGAAPENLHFKGSCGSEVLHRLFVQKRTAEEHQRQKERKPPKKALHPPQIAQENAALDRLPELRIVPVFEVGGGHRIPLPL